MEQTMATLMQQNMTLLNECKTLTALNQKLIEENAELRRTAASGTCTGCNQGRSVECDVQQRYGLFFDYRKMSHYRVS